MSKDKQQARANIPAGHILVREGDIAPDDLIWDRAGNQWIKASDPAWGPHKVKAEDCVAVCRKAQGFREKK
jgi:hypothetical protein